MPHPRGTTKKKDGRAISFLVKFGERGVHQPGRRHNKEKGTWVAGSRDIPTETCLMGVRSSEFKNTKAGRGKVKAAK